MSRKVGVALAVGAAVVATVVPVSLLPAGASTAACGSACMSPSVQLLGSSEFLTVSGSSVKMETASTTNSAQDWTPELEAQVSGGIQAGVVSARLGLQYGSDNLYEFQYAPDGDPSDNCLSASDSEIAGDWTVGLSQCGLTADTLWIQDGNGQNGYVDLISAAAQFDNAGTYTTPFAEPGVLTTSSAGAVSIAALSELGGVVTPSQNWSMSWLSVADVAKERAEAAARAARS
jgi:hypothetical protein